MNELVKLILEKHKRGLWDNIHAKQKRIKHGSGEHMKKPGEKGRPTKADFKRSQKTSVHEKLEPALVFRQGTDGEAKRLIKTKAPNPKSSSSKGD